jgi:tetratricopeptide (TPR) repeat protein
MAEFLRGSATQLLSACPGKTGIPEGGGAFVVNSGGRRLEFRLLLADTTTLRNPRQLGEVVRAILLVNFVLVLMVVSALAQTPASSAAHASKLGSQRGSGADGQSPQQLFIAGETALRNNQLSQAERAFRKVLAIDPQSAGAYANLGVIYMRRKQWDQALEVLRQADRLAPQVAGIRLNVGLVYYRQNDFKSAIAPFESVVRDQPNSSQARYLLGLCYFFNQRWAEAVDTLQPLWGEQSYNMNYLYVLGIAAHKAHRTQLDERANSRLVEVGGGTPEFHLIMGRAHLNNQEDDKAIAEFEQAEKSDPKLPFLHFYKGLVYLHKQDYESAIRELSADLAVDPDVAFTYDKLGTAYSAQEQEPEAEKSFREALRLDPHLVSSSLGLARIYQKQEKFPEALKLLDEVEKLSPEDYTAHYLRAQVLKKMGEREKAKAEFETYTRMMNAAREKRGRELSGEIPNPDLTAEPQ